MNTTTLVKLKIDNTILTNIITVFENQAFHTTKQITLQHCDSTAVLAHKTPLVHQKALIELTTSL